MFAPDLINNSASSARLVFAALINAVPPSCMQMVGAEYKAAGSSQVNTNWTITWTGIHQQETNLIFFLVWVSTRCEILFNGLVYLHVNMLERSEDEVRLAW